ncbi:MAG: phosphoadenosine phosphosulfate reductase [Candidatus Hydrogenedentota bacterium]
MSQVNANIDENIHAFGNDLALLDRLNAMEPEALLAWSHENFGERAAIITSFQNTGCVMIDMASRVAPGLRVVTVDTLRLHDETYALMDEIEKRYGLTIERFQPDPEKLERMVKQHGEFLFFDSKDKQEFCCHIRKVEPNNRALDSVDVWISGLRRDHSEFRKATPKATYVEPNDRPILKLNPLADWDEQAIRRYSDEHTVPHNALYDKGYTSIGCMICTTPTLPWEDKRAGRWRWFNGSDDNKECGIHISGSGI